MGYLPSRSHARTSASPHPRERIPWSSGRRALAVALAFLGGCGPPGPSGGSSDPFVVDDAGRPVRVAPWARRVVSTLPAVTELVVALGAADRLVARTAWDTDPRLAHLPDLGRTLAPGAEAIVGLAPDLVVTGPDAAGTSLVRHLESLGRPVYVAELRGIEDIHHTLERLGRLLGLPGPADSLAAEIRAGLARARERYASAPRPTVLYVLWHDPPLTVGPGTFIDELIGIAGGANVFGDAASPWPSVSLEEVVIRDPDYVVIPRGADAPARPAWLAERAGWRDLSAVREGRVVTVDSDLFHRPGPRVVEAADVLGRALRSGRRRVGR